ncbi:MAG: thioredoxin domain-containing protein [Candidatus Saccharibacteria bacterium]|nr:thioredoxin domain-containing protein [Candidatus Saccharibacteria bacterium]
MNKRLWIILAVLVVACFGGLLWYKSVQEQKEQTPYATKLDATKLLAKDEIIKSIEETENRKLSDTEKTDLIEENYIGPTDAKVVVIEYTDFACSHCQAFSTYAEAIQDDYKDDVLFITRDFSLGYPNSIATLSAGEAAKKLGGNEAFWKMSKLLFQDQKWISSAVPTDERKEIFNKYAKQIGLDVDKFNELLEGYKTNGIQDKIDRDKELGKQMDVTGTPSWFINGERIDTLSDSAIREAIDKALADAN